jgi:hypothetical protein
MARNGHRGAWRILAKIQPSAGVMLIISGMKIISAGSAAASGGGMLWHGAKSQHIGRSAAAAANNVQLIALAGIALSCNSVKRHQRNGVAAKRP